MAIADEAQQKIDAYLNRIRDRLRGLRRTVRTEFVGLRISPWIYRHDWTDRRLFRMVIVRLGKPHPENLCV